MKKTYIAPEALVECHFAEIMQMTVDSVGLKGGVKDQDDTGWGFGGDAGEGITPTAKGGSIWDDLTEEGEEE